MLSLLPLLFEDLCFAPLVFAILSFLLYFERDINEKKVEKQTIL